MQFAAFVGAHGFFSRHAGDGIELGQFVARLWAQLRDAERAR